VRDLQGVGVDDDGGRERQVGREAEALVDAFRGMVTGTVDPATPGNPIGRLAVFAGVKDLPSRVKCAVLPWHTLQAAFNAQPSVSTEAGDDRA
jgi:nitrogen fixation NifU-like protein